MCRIAESYGLMNDFNNAVGTYEKAEEKLKDLAKSNSTVNENLGKVYTKHLMYVYQTLSAKQSDYTKWSASDRQLILKIYDEGQSLAGIDSNTNWVKRRSDMENLKKLDNSPATTEEKGE
jgi:predicted nuclease with TOPRIM domain